MLNDKMLVAKDGPVGRLIFNNPQRHNAVSLDMWEATEQILDQFQRDEAVRVVVLTGAGDKAFVAGADISRFESERASAEQIARYSTISTRAFTKIHQFPKPTIAMIDGYCIGGGLALAVTCDLRFCSDRSSFGLPAARLGVGYPFDGLRHLVEAVGVAAAKDIAFSARRFDARAAYAMGLVNQVLPPEQLEAFVCQYAAGVAENAPLTVKAMKVIFGEIVKDPEQRDLQRCQRLVEQCHESEDYVEGREAFMAKRKPRFTGR